MNIRSITVFSVLSLFPWLSMAATINQFYVLTDNSYYSYSYADWGDGSGDIITNKTTLTGFLQVNIDGNYVVTIDYSNVLLNGSSFRPIDTLVTDATGINGTTLISGFTGEYDYISYGNATLSPFPFICVECGYEMTLNLAANPLMGNPLVLSYHESNPYDTGEVNFELFVSQVPLPATVWLFGSGLIGLLGVGSRKRTYKAN